MLTLTCLCRRGLQPHVIQQVRLPDTITNLPFCAILAFSFVTMPALSSTLEPHQLYRQMHRQSVQYIDAAADKPGLCLRRYLDFVTLHTYAYNLGIPNTQYSWVNEAVVGDRATLAAIANKPLLFEVGPSALQLPRGCICVHVAASAAGEGARSDRIAAAWRTAAPCVPCKLSLLTDAAMRDSLLSAIPCQAVKSALVVWHRSMGLRRPMSLRATRSSGGVLLWFALQRF